MYVLQTFGDKDYIRKPWKTANEVKRNEKCEILLKQLKEAEEIPVVSIQWSETLRALGMKSNNSPYYRKGVLF